MKYSKLFPVACIGLSLLAASCIDYTDNVNPNEVTEDEMKADNLKTGAFFQQMQTRVILVALGGKLSSDYQISRNLSHDLFSGYAGSTLGNLQTHQQYIWQDGWINSTFNEAFTGIMSPWKSVNEIAIAQDRPEIAAVANIVKVAGMHPVADTFGPIPYIGYGSTNAYDSLEDIYKKFFEELDEAIDVLSPYAAAGGNLLSDYDLVYGGNATNWVKFANTLRLRLALRVVYADAALAQAEANKSFACPQGFIESKAERAELNTSLANYENPLYIIDYEFNKGDTRVGASIVEIMNQFGDPRRASYFTALGDGTYEGVPLGITGNLTRYQEECSHFKLDKYGSPVVWMTAAESYFLRAEAALRGWNAGGDAKTFYENGVRTSCEENGVGTAADDYLASKATLERYSDPISGYSYTFKSNATPAWDDAANFEGKLERIATQRWIATFPNGAEGWSIVRRTGYPDLINVITNGSNNTVNSDLGPRRLPFCLQEKQNNAEGVALGVKALGGADNAGTRIWWDKKAL